MREEQVNSGALSRDRLMEQAAGYRIAAILLALVECDVVGLLVERNRSVRELAGQRGLEAPWLAALLDACVALGFLTKHGDVYGATALAASCLAPADEAGGLCESIKYHREYYALWGQLADRASGAQREHVSPELQSVRDPERYRKFIAGVHDAHVEAAERTVGLITSLNPRKLLDIGAGSGVYAIEMLRRFPRLRATLLDFPPALDVARTKLSAACLLDRVEFLGGNFHGVHLGSDYDLVLLSNVLHLEPPTARALLLKRAAAATHATGVVVINEPVLLDSRVEPQETAVFNITALLRSDGVGGLFSNAELHQCIASAGLRVRAQHVIAGKLDLYKRPYSLLECVSVSGEPGQ